MTKKRNHRARLQEIAQRRRKGPGPRTICLAWYTPEEWEAMRAAATDADGLYDTYEDWEQAARNAKDILEEQGLSIRIVDVTAAELIQWCQENERPLNHAARAEYPLCKATQAANEAHDQ